MGCSIITWLEFRLSQSFQFLDLRIWSYKIETDVQAWTNEYHYVTGWMHQICMSVQPQLKLLQEKEKFYKRELQQLLDEEILTALPALGPAGRTKRFAAALIPAIAGLVTLAVESLSGYLQNKRNKYIALAVDALSKENGHYRNQLN